MNKKILLLTHCFPPYVFPESYLATKRMGACNEFDIDVLTMKPFLPWVKRDDDYFSYIKNSFVEIKYLSPPAFYRKLPFHRAEWIFSMPDTYVYLNCLYNKSLENIKKYDAILTWSMYHSIHLVALRLKKQSPNLKWIAHFSDPWTTNPFFKKSKFIHFINKQLEKKVFKFATALTFTSEETVTQVLQGYPESIAKKSFVIPHNFDEKLYSFNESNNKENIIIRYLGSFYKERQPFPLLKALEKIYVNNKKILEDTTFEFIGASDINYNIPDYLKKNISFLPSVSYIASLKEMAKSDILLVIDAPFFNSPFLPSKLIDYIGANKPIFGITPPGTAQKLIEEMGFLVAHPSNPTEVADKLADMLKQVKSGKIKSVPESIRSRFSSKNVGCQMTDLINKG